MSDSQTKSSKLQSLVESRRFWIAIGAGVVAFAKQYDVEIDQTTIDNIVSLAMAWILGDTIRKTA